MLIVERADLLGGHEAFADVAARDVAEVVRNGVAAAHLLVAGVAAGGEDDAAAGVEGQRGAVGALADHAGDNAVLVGQQLLHGGVVDYLAAQVVFIVEGERSGDLAALAVGLSAASGGVVDAPRLQAHVYGLDVQHLVVRLEHAVLLLGHYQLVVRHGEDFLGVALDGRFDGAEPLDGAVEVVHEVAGLARIHELALAVAHFHEVVVDHVLIVVDALALLPFGARAQELAAGARGGAAGDALLLYDDHVAAGLFDLDGGGQAAGAGAADHHVDGADFVLVVGGHLGGGGAQRGDVVLGGAGGHERGGGGAEYGLAGYVSADHGRDIEALILHDELREVLHRGGVQTPGDAAVFAVFGYLDFEDLVLGDGDVYVELAAVAAGEALVCAGIKLHFYAPF